MKEVIVFIVGVVVGGTAATLFTNQVRGEIRLLTNRFGTAVARVEDAAAKIHAKL